MPLVSYSGRKLSNLIVGLILLVLALRELWRHKGTGVKSPFR